MKLTATERRDIHRWLAGFFLRELDEGRIALYRSPDGGELLDVFAEVPALRPLVETLRETVRGGPDASSVRLDLAAAYGRLFLVGGPRAVPLHASAYLSDRGLLMQTPTRDTELVLAALDLDVPPGFSEPADHLGVQLNILAALADGKSADGLSEAVYLRTRLLTWVPTFAALCARLAPVPLYRELGLAVLAWLRAVEASSLADESAA